MKGEDFLFLIILIIAISSIIGLNIVNIIDRKINDISINIPKIEIPQQEIILKIQSKKKSKSILKEPFSVEAMGPKVKIIDETGIQLPAKKLKHKMRPNLTYCDKIKFDESEETNKKTSDKKDIKKDIIKDENINEEEVISQPDGEITIIDKDEVKLQTRKLEKKTKKCTDINTKTGENYYKYYYEHPFIPEPEKYKWLPANYTSYSEFAEPSHINYKIVPPKTATRPPYPSNYE